MFLKKTLVTISVLGSIVFILTLFSEEFGLCSLTNQPCQETFDPIAEASVIFVPALIFSSILYFGTKELFDLWAKVSFPFIVISLIAVFLAPEYSRDWMYPIEKGGIAFFMSSIFVVVSIIIIAFKFFTLKRGK